MNDESLDYYPQSSSKLEEKRFYMVKGVKRVKVTDQ